MRQSPTQLEILRTDRDLSQEALAKGARVSRQVIVEIENGYIRNRRRQVLVRLANFLEVDVDDLFDDRATA
jgi:transcriptional regulator with XRE-family HTH domain